MAVPIHSSTFTSFFKTSSSVSPHSLSCSTKVFASLKPQNSSPFASEIPNSTAGFFDRVSKSLHWRYGSKPTRGRVNMMPFGKPPLVHYKTPGGRQWIDIWNALYRQRIIFIGNFIGEDFSNKILATMLYLDTVDDSSRLYIYITGPGGDLSPSLAIYDTMLSLKSPVGTHCLGFAIGLLAFLLSGGDKGHRSALPNSRISLEPLDEDLVGQADDIRNGFNESLRIKDYLCNELAINTGQTVKKINKDMSCFKGFSAYEAVEYGLIDRVARPQRMIMAEDAWKDDSPPLVKG